MILVIYETLLIGSLILLALSKQQYSSLKTTFEHLSDRWRTFNIMELIFHVKWWSLTKITCKSMRVKIFHIVLFQHAWNIGRLIKKNSLQSIHRLSIWERSRYNTIEFKWYLVTESTLMLFFFKKKKKSV